MYLVDECYSMLYVCPVSLCSLQALRSYVQQYFPQTLYPLSIVPINICEDKLELNWPTDNGWEIIPDSRPCEVC